VPIALAAARKQFGAGTWYGMGTITGGFADKGVNLQISGGGRFAFCVHVSNGRITPSIRWEIGEGDAGLQLPGSTDAAEGLSDTGAGEVSELL
jgi:hypothetical protein